MLQMADGI